MYDDYWNYSAHTDYSDAAERRRKEREAKEKNIEDTKNDIDNYISGNISLFLRNTFNIDDSGCEKTGSDGDYVEITYNNNIKNAIKKTREKEIEAETDAHKGEIREIDKLLSDLARIKGKYGA